MLLVAMCGCHPWFESDLSAGNQPEQPPVLMSPDGYPYRPGTPSWVPLIDACMARGGQRNQCIEGLPSEELEKFLRWEQGQRRHELIRERRERGAHVFGAET